MPTRPGADASPEPARGPLVTPQQIDAVLPQTQCGRCGFPGCLPSAEALAAGESAINRCPPGGEATIVALAQLLQRPTLPLDPACGPTPLRRVAHIRIADCIGCTKCIRACPVDAIIGAPKFQHHVISSRCTGCDLCLAPCPTDCITMRTLDAEWTATDAARARRHHAARQARQDHEQTVASAARSDASQDALRRQDPLAALADPAEKARRLAAILARGNVRPADRGPAR